MYNEETPGKIIVTYLEVKVIVFSCDDHRVWEAGCQAVKAQHYKN